MQNVIRKTLCRSEIRAQHTTFKIELNNKTMEGLHTFVTSTPLSAPSSGLCNQLGKFPEYWPATGLADPMLREATSCSYFSVQARQRVKH